MRWEIPGVVELAGAVEVHREGLRAERARPYALFVSPNANAARAERLAAAHRAQVVPVRGADEAAAWCRDRGLGLSPAEVERLLGPEALAEERRTRRHRRRVTGLKLGAVTAAWRRRSRAGSWRSTRRTTGSSGAAAGSIRLLRAEGRTSTAALRGGSKCRGAPLRCGFVAVCATKTATQPAAADRAPFNARSSSAPRRQFHGSAERRSQYAPGSSASPANASSSAVIPRHARRGRLLSSCATVAAPLSTTPAHGCASTAASASASARDPALGRRGDQRRRRAAVGEPPVRERLLDVDLHPGVVGAGERGARAALVQVPRRLDLVEAAALDRAVDRRRLGGAGDREPDADAARADRVELLAHARVVEDAAVERRGVDLVQRQPIAQERLRLAPTGSAAARR